MDNVYQLTCILSIPNHREEILTLNQWNQSFEVYEMFFWIIHRQQENNLNWDGLFRISHLVDVNGLRECSDRHRIMKSKLRVRMAQSQRNDIG